ncbi:MAG: dephospho-CoA kinase [Gammaproteobacteria bacterium]|nr:dephospho-CoA kinase [Gammaproteobacteria bacterium]
MFRVGLTGGIASGKSQVTELFAALGVPVIDSDIIAREVVAPSSEGFAEVVARFGPAVLDAKRQLDRRALRAIVFADPSARGDLEAITHPKIRARMQALNQKARGPYIINAIPLLAETGRQRDLDRVLVVDCPSSIQLARVMARDQVDEMAARALLAAQSSRAARLAIADDVIVNDRDLAALEAAVRVLHERYLALSSPAHRASTTERSG